MKQFLSQDGNIAVLSSHPVKVNNKGCEEINITKPQQDKLEGGGHTFEIEEQGNTKKLVFTVIPPSPKKALREALKVKLDEGTATDEDVRETLKLLL